MSIWILADQGVSEGTGYSRRILMKLEAIRAFYAGEILLIHPAGTAIPQEIAVYGQTQAIHISKPVFLRRKDVTRQLQSLLATHGSPALLICENLLMAFLAGSFVRKNRLMSIFDYHGAVPEEVYLSHPPHSRWIRKQIYRHLESVALHEATKITVVSNAFKARLLERHSFLEDGQFTVFPMLPSRNLRTEPEELDISWLESVHRDMVVFCYLGQAQAWQLARETINLYRDIERTHNAFLLVLSKDRSQFEAIAKEAGLENYRVLTVDHHHVASYLKYCDYGFVLRAPSVVNQVASPTKVLEYLSQGVLPIMTKHIGDYSGLISATGLGYVLEYSEIMAILKGEKPIIPISKPTSLGKEKARKLVVNYVGDNMTAHQDLIKQMINHR